MSDLFITESKWEPFDGENGQVLSVRIKKHRDSKTTKVHNVIIWKVKNKDSQMFGKFFIVEPQRTMSIPERLELATYDSIDEAKEDAETMLREHLDLVKSGKINWYSRKEYK